MKTLVILAFNNKVEEIKSSLAGLEKVNFDSTDQLEIILLVKGTEKIVYDIGGSNFLRNSRTIVLNIDENADVEKAFSIGLDACLGDEILLLHISDQLGDHVDCLIREHFLRKSPVAFFSEKYSVKRKLIKKIYKLFLGETVKSMFLEPMLLTRLQISAWQGNLRRTKMVRMVHHQGKLMPTYIQWSNEYSSNRRELRQCIRTLLNTSPKLLRFAALFSFFSSGLSLIWTLYIVITAAISKTVEGWVTTNLQISLWAFSTSLVLGLLTEHNYQTSEALLTSELNLVSSEILIDSHHNYPNIDFEK